jgi:curli biogenesis system outer membrane secretion channel CsgG
LRSAWLSSTVLVAFALGSSVTAATAATDPRVAIYGFDSQGVTSWWGVGGFDPGDALSDIMTDKLVNAGGYSVVDRSHIQAIQSEQSLSQSGEVAPSSEAKLGRLLGASYLIFGRIIQFDKTGGQGGNVGGITNRLTGGLLGGGGGVNSTTITLHANIRVVEANTGRIAETVDDTASKSATSFSLSGWGLGGAGFGEGGYTSEKFESSTVGQLLATVADDLVKKLDPGKLVAGPAAPSITGRILSVDGKSIIINAGENKGVTVGTYFTINETKELRDPDSGKMLQSHSKRGSLQITSVDKETAVGELVDGTAKMGLIVISGQ